MNDLVKAGYFTKVNKVMISYMETRDNSILSLEEHTVKEGWVGKAKVVTKVLYKSFMIDLDNI